MEQQKEDKYYTPNLEEFYTGFEFEYKPKEGPWVKVNYNNWMSPSKGMELDFCTENELLRNFNKLDLATKRLNIVRVKYLDHEDIESLGWKYIQNNSIGKDHYKGLFSESLKGNLLFEHDWLNNKITIKTPNYIRDGSGNFDGYIIYINRLIIKNKSELKVLMKQLGIDGK